MKKWILISLAILLAVVFIASTWYLIDYFSKSKENTVLYDELAQIVEDVRQTLPTEQDFDEGESVNVISNFSQVTNQNTGETINVLPEYSKIFEMNNDLVGWIRIDGTAIDYPVLQTPNKRNYYLKHDFEGKQSKYGSIYVQENCNVFLPADNIVIYGHRMNDGSMFADLHKYKDQAFYKAQPYIHFDTLQQRQTYQIISVFLISSVENNPFQYQTFVNAESKADFDEFILNCQNNQLYDTGVSADYGDKLITLSTCEYSNINGRLVVVAKRITGE